MVKQSVAFAGPPLKVGAITDDDGSAPAPDDLAVFQFFQFDADRRAIGADHLSEKVMRGTDDITIDSVLCHKQPARQALRDGVETITGGILSKLYSSNCQATHQHTIQARHTRKKPLDLFCRHSKTRAWSLHNDAVGEFGETSGELQADHFLPASNSDFHTAAIRSLDNHGGNSAIQKIDRCDRPPLPLELGGQLEVHKIEMGSNFEKLGLRYLCE